MVVAENPKNIWCSMHLGKDICASWKDFCFSVFLISFSFSMKYIWKMCYKNFFGCPYRSNGIKIHLDMALTVCEIWSDGCNFYFSFWAIVFCHFTPLTVQKIKILEKWKTKQKNKTKQNNNNKKSLEIPPFYRSVPKIMITSCTVPEIWCAMGSWTAGWHRGVSAPPKNYINRWL